MKSVTVIISKKRICHFKVFLFQVNRKQNSTNYLRNIEHFYYSRRHQARSLFLLCYTAEYKENITYVNSIFKESRSFVDLIGLNYKHISTFKTKAN